MTLKICLFSHTIPIFSQYCCAINPEVFVTPCRPAFARSWADGPGTSDLFHHFAPANVPEFEETRGVEVRGKTITLDADENIELKAGGKIIATAKGDVDVNGANIHLNGG